MALLMIVILGFAVAITGLTGLLTVMLFERDLFPG